MAPEEAPATRRYRRYRVFPHDSCRYPTQPHVLLPFPPKPTSREWTPAPAPEHAPAPAAKHPAAAPKPKPAAAPAPEHAPAPKPKPAPELRPVRGGNRRASDVRRPEPAPKPAREPKPAPEQHPAVTVAPPAGDPAPAREPKPAPKQPEQKVTRGGIRRATDDRSTPTTTRTNRGGEAARRADTIRPRLNETTKLRRQGRKLPGPKQTPKRGRNRGQLWRKEDKKGVVWGPAEGPKRPKVCPGTQCAVTEMSARGRKNRANYGSGAGGGESRDRSSRSSSASCRD